MAEAATDKPTLTLSEQYLLKQKEEKPDLDLKPTETNEEVNPVNAAPVEVAAEKAEEISEAVSEVKTDDSPAASEESTETNPGSTEDNNSDVVPAPTGESNETTEEEQSGEEEVSKEEPEIKLETAPADFRFPTTNQTRHCFTRYIEYHRCTAAKGEGAQECDRFAKYYRALCPGEWVCIHTFFHTLKGANMSCYPSTLFGNHLFKAVQSFCESGLHVPHPWVLLGKQISLVDLVCSFLLQCAKKKSSYESEKASMHCDCDAVGYIFVFHKKLIEI